jgi:hypothetical protein
MKTKTPQLKWREGWRSRLLGESPAELFAGGAPEVCGGLLVTRASTLLCSTVDNYHPSTA